MKITSIIEPERAANLTKESKSAEMPSISLEKIEDQASIFQEDFDFENDER